MEEDKNVEADDNNDVFPFAKPVKFPAPPGNHLVINGSFVDDDPLNWSGQAAPQEGKPDVVYAKLTYIK